MLVYGNHPHYFFELEFLENNNIVIFVDMPTYSNFFRSFGTSQQKWKLAAVISSVGLSTVGLLWQQNHHHASSYSIHLKRYSASAEYPQLAKHSNLMARQLTPQVRILYTKKIHNKKEFNRCMLNFVIVLHHLDILLMMLYKLVLIIPVYLVVNILV
jgi:hypothetical protein